MKFTNKKRENIFNVLIIIGLLFILAAFFRYLQPADISGSWKLFIDENNMPRMESEFYLTGREAIIFVLGLLIIIAAFLFRYKRFPKIKFGL